MHDGYKLIEDAWENHGRLTYLHNDDATREYLQRLVRTLGPAGWEIDTVKLRSFRHHSTGEMIEIEPGGSQTTGHFLHHMKPSTIDAAHRANQSARNEG